MVEFILLKKILNNEFKNDSSIENDVIKKFIKEKVAKKYSNKFFIDIGTYKNLSIAKKKFDSQKTKFFLIEIRNNRLWVHINGKILK